MMEAAIAEPVELRQYTDHLARHLVGSYARRSEILDEVMDGLQCAAEDNLRACPDRAEAARRAVLEWGAPGDLARAYNDATLRLSAHRLTLHAVSMLPLLAVIWAVTLLASPQAPWMHHPPILVFGVSMGALGGLLCLLGALVGLRRGSGMRAAVTSRNDTVTTGTLAAITGLIFVMSALSVLLINRGFLDPTSLNWHLVPFPAALTLLVAAYFVTSLKRFLLVVRRAGTA